MQKCENCEREIGNLEKISEHEGHKVCQQCYALLDNTPSRQPVVIEKTSKKYKGMQVAGILTAIFGFCLIPLVAEDEVFRTFALFLALGGLVMFLVGRIKAWWHHG